VIKVMHLPFRFYDGTSLYCILLDSDITMKAGEGFLFHYRRDIG
jgi:hypothetical protein